MDNYRILKKESIEEIKSQCVLLEHKSGAKVICAENEDADRVFSLSFGTKPKDDTGVFHILEHTVLCGSKKYPVHDPFNDLDKGSLNTYLNAITFYDKTVYPVASTNEKDFFNLVKVYCDGVFNPLIGEEKGIFLQEGVNFDGEKISGVVYNEMKGVFSEPQEILSFEIKKKLYKDNGYCFYSGGVPENIPELTYEKFIECYNKYYKPSNCVIYIYGKLDFEKYLNFLDKEYLSKYKYEETKEDYKEIKPFENPKNIDISYCCDDEKTYLQASFALTNAKDVKEIKALEVLGAALTDTESSPLFKALEEAEIGDNIEYFIDDNMYQPSFNISVSGSSEQDTRKFRQVIEKTFINLYENGIDERLIKGAVNNQLFYINEEDFGYKPKGLFYNMELLTYFLYGKEDFDGLKFNELYSCGYDYKRLLKKYFIDNKSCVYGILKPSASEKGKKEHKMEKNTDELFKYQSKEDSESDKAKIPYIEVCDVSKEIEKIETQVYKNENVDFIYNRIEKDIIYFALLFDTSCVPYELKKYINVYSYLVGKTGTKKYSAERLDSDINYYLGGFSAFYSSFFKKDGFFPAVVFEGKALNQQADKLFGLMFETVENSVFNDRVKITRLLKELKNKYEQNFIYGGNKIAAARAAANFSPKYMYDEYAEGIEFYFNLCRIIKKLEDDRGFEEVIRKINEVRNFLIQKKNIYVSLVCGEGLKEKAEKRFSEFIKGIDFGDETEKCVEITNKVFGNEAFIINGNTCFNGKSFKGNINFKSYGHILLLNKIVSSDYLWKKVRGEGGAYGSGSRIDRYGNVFISSYRDNEVKKTYSAFDNIFDYIANLNITEKELDKYKIGALSEMSKPVKNNERGFISAGRFFGGITEDMLNSERESLINARIGDIKENAGIFLNDGKNSFVCTLCGSGFDLSGEIFDKQRRL